MHEGEKFIPQEGERTIISFDDLIDPNRRVPDEYQALIRSQEQRGEHSERFNDTGFATNWNALFRARGREAKFAEPEVQYLKEHVRDQALIDLGGNYGYLRDIARMLGVQTYVNVDRSGRGFSTRHEPNPLQPIGKEQYGKDKDVITWVNVKADMLDFLARLKDGSSNITINGIDLVIVNDQAYHQALANELIRVTRPNGLIFGIESRALEILHQKVARGDLDLKRHELSPEIIFGIETYIFEKQA